MDIVKELEKLRMPHDSCEDCWYSCPKSENGCCDEEEGEECNCGADQHNAILDSIIKDIAANRSSRAAYNCPKCGRSMIKYRDISWECPFCR